MTGKTKINQLVKQFPALSGHEDMIEFTLGIRETFALEKVPFRIKAGSWDSGNLDTYYQTVEQNRLLKRQAAKDELKKKHRKGRSSSGWVRY